MKDVYHPEPFDGPDPVALIPACFCGCVVVFAAIVGILFALLR